MKEKKRKSNRTLPLGEAMFNQLLLHYKWHAKRRKLDWFLEDKYFRELTKQPCFYCGVLPNNVWGAAAVKRKVGRANGVYIYNGIDRINPKEGYTKDNCVSCCTKCNRSKWDLSQDEFLEHIKTLYNHLELWK